MKNYTSNYITLLPVFLLAFFFLIQSPALRADAETASAVTTGEINYEELTLQIFNNNNTKVYYSTDNTTWTDLEAVYNTTDKSYSMDISWIDVNNDVMLYFKGDAVNTVKTLTLPKLDKTFNVTFNKAECEFTFTNTNDSDDFEWRKNTDYTWNKVSLNEASASYQSFLSTIQGFQVKGAKIIVRIPQVLGTAGNEGSRPSREIMVAIPARAEGPSIKLNPSKLTVNTTTSMEYYNVGTSTWVECSKDMSLELLAPSTLFQNGAKAVTLLFRKAATASSPYSKTTSLLIPGQAAAPTIGDSSKDVSYYYVNSKLVLCFNKAMTGNTYEYTVIKQGYLFNLSTAKWSTVSNSKPLTVSNMNAPDGCTVYVRKKGTEASSSKNISLTLASAYSTFAVKY